MSKGIYVPKKSTGDYRFDVASYFYLRYSLTRHSLRAIAISLQLPRHGSSRRSSTKTNWTVYSTSFRYYCSPEPDFLRFCSFNRLLFHVNWVSLGEKLIWRFEFLHIPGSERWKFFSWSIVLLLLNGCWKTLNVEDRLLLILGDRCFC